MTTQRFKKLIWEYYKAHGRHTLAWRRKAHINNPYRVLVSEIMLQQTQVSRVMKKYPEFIRQFPDFRSLAKASVPSVLSAWQGMGYNRRALNLKRLGEAVVERYKGRLPSEPEVLRTLPGIGVATSGSIAAFAFNRPIPFIETNIRRVFIHSFFSSEEGVDDEDILRLVQKTLDRENPREWYYALMDYGTMLAAKEKENPNRKSLSYRRQAAFMGSRRAVRGGVLRVLLAHGPMTERALASQLKEPIVRIREVLDILKKEKFVIRKGDVVKIAG